MSHKAAQIIFTGLLWVLAFAPSFSHAQSLLGDGAMGINPLVLRLNPSIPAPNQAVRAEITSTVVDLSRSKIIWMLNGARLDVPDNATSISFQAPTKVGATSRIAAVVSSDNGRTLTEEQSVQTGILDVVWEADAYTPPFYKGKALPTTGTPITIAAFADIRDASGRRISENELVFTWEQYASVMPELSGRGKHTAVFDGPEIHRDLNVLLSVAPPVEDRRALVRIALAPTTPQVILYEKHPTLGIRFEQALTRTFTLAGGEVTLSAQPFFFSTPRSNSESLAYQWSLNNVFVDNPSTDQSAIVLRAESGGGGAATVGVSTKHTSKLFQEAGGSVNIRFFGEPAL